MYEEYQNIIFLLSLCLVLSQSKSRLIHGKTKKKRPKEREGFSRMDQTQSRGKKKMMNMHAYTHFEGKKKNHTYPHKLPTHPSYLFAWECLTRLVFT
jgi:hypothetical protein